MTKVSRLHEQCIASEVIYQGDFLTLKKDQIRQENGFVSSREYVVHPGAAVIVPLDAEGNLWLEQQFRYPVGQVLLEFPAGKLDPNETPLYCAQRELQEETGLTAAKWAYAGRMHLAVGYSSEILHIFFAKELQQGASRLDAGEQVELIRLTPAELFSACQSGAITDAKTLSCCLWLQNVRSGAWQLDWQAAEQTS